MAGDYETSRKKLNAAKKSFTDILNNLNASEIDEFNEWVLSLDLQQTKDLNKRHNISKNEQEHQKFDFSSNCKVSVKNDRSQILDRIAEDLRALVPFDGTMSTENIIDHSAEQMDDNDQILHIDGFLYDDEAVDSLVDEGKLHRDFCVDCGSRNIQSITFISHSMTNEQMRFLFTNALPQISEDKNLETILDIGSRIGAVLYGAYVYTCIKKIIGVEINEELSSIQRKIIKKHSMDDRISVLHADINDCQDVIARADIIILHNVFEYFLPLEEQKKTWLNLRKAIKKDTLLVTVPSLEESISFDESLMDTMDVTNWLKPLSVNFDECKTMDNEQLANIQTMYFYKVVS